MTTHTFATPPTDRFFEDYTVGATYECGSVHLTEAEIIAFAREYDPQMMHVDRALAAEGPFHEIIASGWQTMAVTMRKVVEGYLPFNGLVAPGVDEVRWHRPVRPGDTLSVRVTVTDARRSKSRPDRGLVHSLVETLNQHGEVVMSFKPMNFVRARKPDGGEA
jgi:acyl dehydratase